jgi:hypothetical protein
MNNFNIENFNAISLDDQKEQATEGSLVMEAKKVYIANQSGHDFSPSSKYGLPVYVTKGLINRFSVNFMARKWALSLKDSKKEDFILVTSLTILTCVGCAIFGYLHKSLNLLVYRNGKYINRTIDFENLFQTLDFTEDEKEEDQ